MYSCLLVVLAVTWDVPGYWWKGYSSECVLTIKNVKFTIFFNLETLCWIVFLSIFKDFVLEQNSQSCQTLEGGTEPSFNNVYGKLFPQNESRPTYSCIHTGNVRICSNTNCNIDWRDTFRSVQIDLLVANGADVKRTSQETVGIWSNSIVANESQGHCWLTFKVYSIPLNL